MKLINQDKLDQLNSLSSDTLEVIASSQCLTMRLKKVVALTNFKTLAAAGRWERGSFDPRTKTLTLSFISPTDMLATKIGVGSPGTSDYEVVDVHAVGGQYFKFDPVALREAVALCSFDLDKLVVLAKRLAGSKAKTYTSIKDAKKSTRPRFEWRVSGPEDMDMPMWDPVAKEWYDQEVQTRRGGQDRWTGRYS